MKKLKKTIKSSLLLLLCCALMFTFACNNTTDKTPANPDDPGTGTPDTPAKKEYTVTFEPENGAGATAVKVAEGEKAAKPADPAKSGFAFEGWFKDGAAYDFSAAVNGDITLKAQWKEDIGVVPTVKEQPNEVTASQMGGSVAVSLNETRGYTYSFVWYKNDTASTAGGKVIEGQTEARLVLPAGLEVGKTFYVYADIIGTRTLTGAQAKGQTGLTKVTVEEKALRILMIGSGVMARTVAGEEQDSSIFLQTMARAAGYSVTVDKLTSGSNYNIWETGLTGEGFSKVEELCKLHAYDYIVLQMGRDYALLNASTRGREITAVQGLTAMAQKYNPNCATVALVSYARQDGASNYATNVWQKLDPVVTDRAGHVTAIDGYWNTISAELGINCIVADANKTFDAAVSDGLSVYTSDSGDFANVNGSYLVASTVYAAIFGNPVGVMCFDAGSYSVDPSLGVKLQVIAAEEVLNIKTADLPDVSGYKPYVDTYVEPTDPTPGEPAVKDPADSYPQPTVMGEIPVDKTKGKVKIFLFGGYSLGSSNAVKTFCEFIRQQEKLEVVTTSAYLGHASTSSTWNAYELFTAETRTDPDKIEFSTTGTAAKLKTAMVDNAEKYDYMIIQTGRDFTLNSPASQKNNIYAICKLVKTALANNPNVKVILLAPYGHTTVFTDFKDVQITNLAEHTAEINKEAELTKAAVAKLTSNVEIAYVSNAFMNYSTDANEIAKDLYRANDFSTSRGNTANRASAAGGYIVAATLYATIFDKTPVGANVAGSFENNIDALVTDGAQMLRLQKAAHKAVFGKNYSGSDEFTISFNANGGTKIASVKAKAGAKIDAPAEPKNGSYKFAGWFSDAKLTQRFSFVKNNMPAHDVTLYAGWAGEVKEFSATDPLPLDAEVKILLVGSGVVARDVDGHKQDTAEFLGGIAKKAGYSKAVVDKYTMGSNWNIWETGFSGENASKIEEVIATGRYDFVIVQLGRDYCLTTNSVLDKEAAIINKIGEIAKTYNPVSQVVLFASYARQDNTSNYYQNVYAPLRITTRDLHSAAITAYVGRIEAALTCKYEVCDINKAFELCIANTDINPYGSSTEDFQDVYGSYLSASCLYATIFNANPVGVLKFSGENFAVKPTAGVKLQAIAAEVVLGVKTATLPKITDDWKDPDTGETVDAQGPSTEEAGGSTVKDETVEGAVNIMFFGGYPMGYYDLIGTLKSFISEGTGKPLNVTQAYLAQTSTSSTWNIYEMFAATARTSFTDFTFSSGTGAKFNSKLLSTKFDYLVLQTGRDFSIKTETSQLQNIASICKIAQMAYEKNPSVKILLVAPYGHMATFDDFVDIPITDYKTHVTYINKEAEATKKAILDGGYATDVSIISLGDLFTAYSADVETIKADLFCEADTNATRKNVGNRASAKGAYLGASAIYCAMYNKSCVGMPLLGKTNYNDNFDTATVLSLQQLATKFVTGKDVPAPTEYSVVFNTNGGSEIAPVTGAIGTAVTAPEDPVKEDFVFKGWYEDSEFNTEVVFADYKIPFGGKVLFARWMTPAEAARPEFYFPSNATEYNGKAITVLMVGSGAMKRTNAGFEHDSSAFLFALLDKAGYKTEVRTLFLGNNYNLYETDLTGENYSKVEALLADGKVDAVIVQGCRDYNLTTSSSREIDAINNISKYAKKYNPEAKCIYMCNYARREVGTTYYTKVYSTFGISTPEEVTRTLNKHVLNTVIPAVDANTVFCNTNRAFATCYEATSINPWMNDNCDTASVEGSYLLACCFYAAVTGKSPVGLLRFDCDGYSIKPTDGVQLQKIAAETVLDIEEVELPDVDDSYVERKSLNILVAASSLTSGNGMAANLRKIASEDGKNVIVTTLTGGSTIADYVEMSNIDVELKYSGIVYDYVVLEAGRDSVLYDAADAAAEKQAMDTILAKAQANNPDVQIIIVAPAARQNVYTQYFKNVTAKTGVTDRASYAAAVTAHAKTLAGDNEAVIVCDIASAAEACMANGINVYTNTVSDYTSAQYSYLVAAALYATAFNSVPSNNITELFTEAELAAVMGIVKTMVD